MILRRKYQAFGGDWYASIQADDGRIMEIQCRERTTESELAAMIPPKEEEKPQEEAKSATSTTITIVIDGRPTDVLVSQGCTIAIDAGKISDGKPPIEGKLECCACGYPFEKDPEVHQPAELFFRKEYIDQADPAIFLEGSCFFHEKCFKFYSENPKYWLELDPKHNIDWPEKI
jgi:hypothetical protein